MGASVSILLANSRLKYWKRKKKSPELAVDSQRRSVTESERARRVPSSPLLAHLSRRPAIEERLFRWWPCAAGTLTTRVWRCRYLIESLLFGPKICSHATSRWPGLMSGVPIMCVRELRKRSPVICAAKTSPTICLKWSDGDGTNAVSFVPSWCCFPATSSSVSTIKTRPAGSSTRPSFDLWGLPIRIKSIVSCATFID